MYKQNKIDWTTSANFDHYLYCQVFVLGRRKTNEYTNAHYTVVKNGRFINYINIKFPKIFVILTNNLDYITQMDNEIIEFLRLGSFIAAVMGEIK